MKGKNIGVENYIEKNFFNRTVRLKKVNIDIRKITGIFIETKHKLIKEYSLKIKNKNKKWLDLLNDLYDSYRYTLKPYRYF